MKRVSRLAKRDWYSKELDAWESELETLDTKVECREAQEFLKDKLSKLEKKLAEQGTDKLGVTKVVINFDARIKELEMSDKGQEVELLSVREEKRIKLCILVDYQHDRYNELKKSVLKISSTT